MKNMKKEGIALLFHIESVLLFDLLPLDERIAHQRVCIQILMGNRHSPTVIAAAITSQMNKAKLPTHIELVGQDCGLTKDSIVLLEQIRTLDKRRLREHMGRLDGALMDEVDRAIAVSFGLHANAKEV